MPPGAKEKKLGQIVRWLPGSENSTAANTEWKKFCTNHDGGAGNGQFHGEDNNKGSKGQVNEDLVSLKGPGKEIKHKGPNDKTTTTTQYEAKYTRAVFEIKFDQLWPTMPSGGNDWGLKENPCWPEDIVPDDPGFVLLTDDPWYTTAASEKVRDQVKASLYATRPPKEMKDRADKARDQRGQKRPHSPDDNGPNKQPAGNPPSKRALEIIDGFAIRDVNITRRLTDKEVERNVEIIQCADRTCSEERRILGEEDGVLVIRGEGPSMTPPTNVDTVPTIHPRAATTLEIRVDKRNLASPELPEATVAAS